MLGIDGNQKQTMAAITQALEATPAEEMEDSISSIAQRVVSEKMKTNPE